MTAALSLFAANAFSPKLNADVYPEVSVKELNAAGIAALKSGALNEALADFQRAARLDPKNTRIAFNIGLTDVRLGRYKDAIVPLRRAAAVPGASATAHYLLGVSLYEVSDFDSAIAQLKPLSEQAPGHEDEILYLLEESYRRGRHPAMAKRAFSELLARYPESALVHKLMGIAYDEQGDPDRALAEFKKAANLNPRIQDVHLAIGILYLNKREDGKAARWFLNELVVNPCQPAAHYYLGEIDRRAGHLEPALVQFKKASQCDPSFADAYLGLGLVFQTEHRTTQSLNELRTATRLAPEDREAHYQLARALAKSGYKQAAEKEFQKVRQISALGNKKSAEKLGMGNEAAKIGSLIK